MQDDTLHGPDDPSLGARLDLFAAAGHDALSHTFYSDARGWLWPGYLPFLTPTVLDGPSGIGKSLVALDLAARVTSGFIPPGADTTARQDPAGVVYFGAQDDLRTVAVPRFLAAGGDPQRLLVFNQVPSDGGHARITSRLVTRTDEENLLRAIAAVRALLVIFDPCGAFLGGYYSSQEHDARWLLDQQTRIARQAGCAILLVRRARGRQPDSDELPGAARAVLRIARAPNPEHPEERLLLSVKQSYAASAPAQRVHITTPDALIQAHAWHTPMGEQTLGLCRLAPCLQWQGPSDVSADELRPEADDEKFTAIGEAATLLRAVLKDGPHPAGEVLDEARWRGISRTTLHLARTRLGVRTERHGYGIDAHWLWVPPWQPAPTAESPSASALESNTNQWPITHRTLRGGTF